MANVVNQRRPIDQLATSGEPGAEVYPIADVVNYNVLTPLSYWKAGAPSTPPGALARRSQMQLFRGLYAGDWSQLLGAAYPIRANYFRRMANNLTDLMIAYPPTVESAPAGTDTERLDAEIFGVLDDLIPNMVITGTGLIRAFRNATGPHIESPDPEYWFPAPNGDAVVIPLPAGQTQVLILVGGTEIKIDFAPTANEWDGLGQDINAGMLAPLGRMAGATVGQSTLPGPALWPVAMPPANGRFGVSMIPDMVPLVVELSRRLSKSSITLNRHADPILVFREDEQYPTYNDAAPGEELQIRNYTQRVFLDEWRKQWITMLPPEYKSAEYITWDAQMLATNAHYDKVKTELFDSTPLSPLITSNWPVGNVSIRKAYAPLYAAYLRIRARIKQQLEGALSVAAGGPVKLEWPDAVELIDTQTIVNVGVSGDGGKSQTGEPPGPGDPVENQQ